MGESDAHIVLLCPGGRLDCVVTKALRSQRWGALIEPLSLLEGQFSRGKSFVYLREATMLAGFPKVRENLDLLSIAGYWIDLCGNIIQEHQESTLLFRALVWALKMLGDGAPRGATNFWFALHLLNSLGAGPSLQECLHCGNPGVVGWDIPRGGLVCPRCHSQRAFPLSPLAVSVLRALSVCPAQSLQDLHLPRKECHQLYVAVRAHMQHQLSESIRVHAAHTEIGALLCEEDTQ